MESYSPVLSPIEPYVRTPLRDTTNQYTPSSSKKSEGGETPKCQRTFTKESEADENLTSSGNSTPKKILEGDPESDTTAEYESAGEASPWGKEPNLSALADCLAGVHLSTPDKKVPTKLNHFPFSPITAEDESDEEVTAIISHKTHSTNAGSLSLMEEEDLSQKNSSFNDGKNTPFVVISPSQVVANSTLEKSFEKIEHNCSSSTKSDSFRVIPELLAGDFTQSVPSVKMKSTSELKIEEKDKHSPISPTVEFQDAGPACSFHSEIMNNLEAQLLSGTPNSSLMSNNSLIIEGCRHTDIAQASVSSSLQEINVQQNKITEKINENKCVSSNNKSFSNMSSHHEEINVISKNVTEREPSISKQNTSHEIKFSELKEIAVISQNSSDSLKDEVPAGGQPEELLKQNLNDGNSCVTLTNNTQIESAESINTVIVSEGVMSSIKTASDEDESDNKLHENLEMDLNKSVSLKDILFDKPCSAVNVATSSVMNLSIKEKPEAALCKMTPEATDIQIAQNQGKTSVLKTEVIKSDCVFSQNSHSLSESSLNNTNREVPVSQEESSEPSVEALMPEKNSDNALDVSTSKNDQSKDDSLLEIRTDEKTIEHVESVNVVNESSTNISEDVSKLADKSHSIDLEKKCLDLSEGTVSSAELLDNSKSEFIHVNENESIDQTDKNLEQIDIKGAFSQSSTNLSDNVHKFANEKHPICLEVSSEFLDSKNCDNIVSKEIILSSSEIVGSSENVMSLMEIEIKDENRSNISITEMCNLIETTFNNSLKENLDEICENITSTNLKPILLEKKVSEEGDSHDCSFASSPVETVIFTPETTAHDVSTDLKLQCEQVTDSIEKSGDLMSLQLANNSLSLGQPSASDGNSESSSKNIDSIPSNNEYTTSCEVVSSETLNSILILPSKTDQSVIPLSNENNSLLNTSINEVAIEIINKKTTEIQKNTQMVNVEVIPCFPLAVSPETKLLKSHGTTVHIKEKDEIRKSGVTKLDNCVLAEVKSLNIHNESSSSGSTPAAPVCIATLSSPDQNTSRKLTAGINKEMQSANEARKIETQNTLESLNICSEFVDVGVLTNESKEVENSKTIDISSKTVNNESSQHNANSPSTNKDNSNNDSLRNVDVKIEPQATIETNDSPMLKVNTLPMSQSFTAVPSIPSTNSNDNADCTDICSEQSFELNSMKTEFETCHPVELLPNTSELDSLSIIKKVESNSMLSNESTNQHINIEEKISESSSLISSAEQSKNTVSSNFSSDIQFTPQDLLGISERKETEVPHVVDKIESSTNIDKKQIYSESMKIKPSLSEVSVPDDCKNSTSKSGDHRFSINANNKESSSSQSFIKKSELSEIVEGMANMQVDLKHEELFVSKNIMELKHSSQELSCKKTNSGSSPVNKKINITKPLVHEEKSEVKALSQNNQNDNVEQNSITEGFPLKPPSTTSAGNVLLESGSEDVLSLIGQNTTDVNHINSVSSHPQLTKGDTTNEQSKSPSRLNKTQELIKSPFNKSLKESKQSHQVIKEYEFNKFTIERKSYDDLLDKCFEQERLLDFDESIKEEADKIVKDLENFGNATSFAESKSSNLTSSKVNSSEAGPTTAEEDIEKGDTFLDATNFDFEYLSKIRGKPGDRRTIRESLFLKFDPLASTTSPNPIPIPVTSPQTEQNNKQQPDSSTDVLVTPPRAPVDREGQLVNITPLPVDSSSPLTRQTPQVKLRKSTGSVTPSVRHEFLSKEIYKLQELLLTQESAYQEQMAACLDEIDELKQRLAELESQEPPHELEEKLLQAQSEIEGLKKRLEDDEKQKKDYLKIIVEYDQTAVTIAKRNKKLSEEVAELKLEKEQDKQHLRNMEIAFNDIHQKYEKSKEAIASFQQNEAEFKFSIAQNEKAIEQAEEKYQKMLAHASQKLEVASKEITEMQKAHKSEIAKLEAMNKKMEIQVKSLEENLEQKKTEVAELTKICDELINKFPRQ